MFLNGENTYKGFVTETTVMSCNRSEIGDIEAFDLTLFVVVYIIVDLYLTFCFHLNVRSITRY